MQLKFRTILSLLLLAVLLAGCAQFSGEGTGSAASIAGTETSTPEETATPETTPMETIPVWTAPSGGATCQVTNQASYTADENPDAVVATAGDAQLTNAQLRTWYWLEVAAYRQVGHAVGPDFTWPLELQRYPLDDLGRSWQQYFLARALDSWHGAQALALQARDEGVPTEEAYMPNAANHERCLTGKPATRFLYGYNDSYQPNTMHQAYLDSMEQLLEKLALEKGYADCETMAREALGCTAEDLAEAARLYNLGYMYLTTLSYEITCTEEEVLAYLGEHNGSDEIRVDFRHILLIPEGEGVTVAPDGTVSCTEEAWEACIKKAEKLLRSWEKDSYRSEKAFSELANKQSQDPGSALIGGAYLQVAPGQMTLALDQWLFAEGRKAGDTGVIRSEYGCHVMYFSGSGELGRLQVLAELTAAKQAALVDAAKRTYPIAVDYSRIALTEAEARVSREEVLYPDVAHERFPEVPLYLQQDYPQTMYGGFPVASHGCGITSMAMLASYMTDDEQTVPEMCARFGRYCLETGTNYMLFVNEPAGMGFFLREYTRSAADARAALEQGYIVVSLQRPGYWTKAGHFIVIEELVEDGRVRVRDSNIFNFGTLSAHKEDLHGWDTVTPKSTGYWIYQHKVTAIPACARCGSEEALEGLMTEDYFCHKCTPAMLRRDTYLNLWDR